MTASLGSAVLWDLRPLTSLSLCWADSWLSSLVFLLSLPPFVPGLRQGRCHLGQALPFEQARGILLTFQSSVKQGREPKSLQKDLG